jgi:hypothetical protein
MKLSRRRGKAHTVAEYNGNTRGNFRVESNHNYVIAGSLSVKSPGVLRTLALLKL